MVCLCNHWIVGGSGEKGGGHFSRKEQKKKKTKQLGGDLNFLKQQAGKNEECKETWEKIGHGNSQ